MIKTILFLKWELLSTKDCRGVRSPKLWFIPLVCTMQKKGTFKMMNDRVGPNLEFMYYKRISCAKNFSVEIYFSEKTNVVSYLNISLAGVAKQEP